MHLFKELVSWRTPELEARDHFSNRGRSHKNLMSVESARKMLCSNLCSNTTFNLH